MKSKTGIIVLSLFLVMNFLPSMAMAEEYQWTTIYETDFYKTNNNLWMAEHHFSFEEPKIIDAIAIKVFSEITMPSEIATISLINSNNSKLFHRENVNMTSSEYGIWEIFLITPSLSMDGNESYKFELRIYANAEISTLADSPIKINDDYVNFKFAEEVQIESSTSTISDQNTGSAGLTLTTYNGTLSGDSTDNEIYDQPNSSYNWIEIFFWIGIMTAIFGFLWLIFMIIIPSRNKKSRPIILILIGLGITYLSYVINFIGV